MGDGHEIKQKCPQCGNQAVKNNHEDKFKCPHCGWREK